MAVRKGVSKILILTIKYYPIVNAFILCINNVLHYFGVHYYFIDYCVFTALMSILLLYIISYVLEFCRHHRVFIHYMLLELVLSYIDEVITFDITDKNFLYLQMIIFCVFLFVALDLYLYDKDTKKPVNANN